MRGHQGWKMKFSNTFAMSFFALAAIPTACRPEAWTTPREAVEDPQFRLAIGNVTTPLGREAVLSCTVDSLGKYKVGWLRAEDQTVLSLHTKVVTHNSRVSVTHDDHQHTWRLHIRQVKEADRGCYMCQINTSVMKKQVGCVDVHVPPDISYEDTSSDVFAKEGENTTLVCTAKGHPQPRITWRREDGRHMVVRKGLRELATVESCNGSRLHFWRLDRVQMGAYLCIASNDIPPAVSKRIILNIIFSPVVKVPNQLLGAPFGTDVQLECHIEAFPNTINYWVKNRGEMLLQGPKYYIHENQTNYKTFMWLVVKSFSEADIGTYNCVSTNSLGRAEGTLRLYEIKVHSGIRHRQENGHTAMKVAVPDSAREESIGRRKTIFTKENNNVMRKSSLEMIVLTLVLDTIMLQSTSAR